LDFKYLTKFWTMVGLGLRFQHCGLDLDRKIWQAAHLWSSANFYYRGPDHLCNSYWRPTTFETTRTKRVHAQLFRHRHGRNFVAKCGGGAV